MVTEKREEERHGEMGVLTKVRWRRRERKIRRWGTEKKKKKKIDDFFRNVNIYIAGLGMWLYVGLLEDIYWEFYTKFE